MAESSWEAVADRLPKSSSCAPPRNHKEDTTKLSLPARFCRSVFRVPLLYFFLLFLILIYLLLFVFKVLRKTILVLRSDALFVTIPSQQVENIRSSMPTKQQPTSHFSRHVFAPASNLIS